MKPALPPRRPLSTSEQLSFLLAKPRTTFETRRKTARLLSRLDRFEEAIAEYAALEDDRHTPADKLELIKLNRAMGTPHHLAAARDLLDETLPTLEQGNTKNAFLIELGDMFRKDAKPDEALAHFDAVLGNDPNNQTALRKYVVTQVDRGNFQSVLKRCEDLSAQGINNTRLSTSHLNVLAMLGRLEEAEELRDFDRCFTQKFIAPPAGHTLLDAFNQGLAAEILNNPSLRFENHIRASKESWRVEELRVRKSLYATGLLNQIADEVENYCNAFIDLDEDDQRSPFLARKPQSARISAWSVITREEGFENWHTHDSGWLSGVYYVKVPEQINAGSGTAGAIEFGWSERLVGEGMSAKFGNKIIHPEAGMLLLFPSHIQHRTFPHGSTDDRICVAFDIIPTG